MSFFNEYDLVARKSATLRAPPVPDTGWRPPQYFPELRGAKMIAFDVETYDPMLKQHGPGWARGPVGYICGVSIAAEMPNGARGKWYFPVRHQAESHDNLDPKHVFAWVKDMLETPHIPKCGANLMYDIGWLTEENVWVQGPLYDVQTAEALLHEAGEVNLDFLSNKYLGVGKTTETLYHWCAQAFGGKVGSEQRANIYRTPPRLVGPYAEDDADQPLQIIAHQLPLIDAEQLDHLFRLENDLIPMLVQMRREGVSINTQHAGFLDDELGAQAKELNARLAHSAGFSVNVGVSEHIARVFDGIGLKYARTATGAPSFRKDFLKNLDHPIADLINEIREVEKLRSTFVRGYLLQGNVAGKIHCTFASLRDDENGTRTGRFSCLDPNLQNIPIRSDRGKLIRKAFIMDRGHLQWRKYDFSQIEYRFHVHYAIGQGADEVRQRFCSDPATDYHDLTYDLVCPFMGWDITDKSFRTKNRKPIKNINFGLLYGMGEGKLARQLGLSPDQAKILFKAYHEGNPYTKTTMKALAEEAQQQGYVTTILGRRRRFDLWEPMDIDYEDRKRPLPYESALRFYGPLIKRAETHKAINSRYQGSSADQMKSAMRALWQSGVLNHVGVPRLTVHDELDFSQRDDSPITREAFEFVHHTMENVIQLRIPVRADCSTAENWGMAA